MNIRDTINSLYEDRQLVYDVLDNLPLGVITFNNLGQPIFVNQTFADLLGVTLKDILSATEKELCVWLGDEKATLATFQSCQNGVEGSIKAHLKAQNGEKIPVKINAFPLYNKSSRIVGVFALIHDLRQQVLWERSHQEYLHVLDAINTAMISIDTSGVITNCNKCTAEFFNTEPAQLIGRPFKELANKLGHGGNCLLKTANTGIPVSIPEMTLDTDGNRLLITMDAAPLLDTAGQITGAVGLYRDITLQRLMEAEAHRAEKLALVGELAAGTAHEIRNPLTSVRGFIQLLKNRFSLDAPEQDYLEIMLGELDRANGIIKNFLLLAKPQVPKLQLQDLNYILNELIKLVEGETILAEVELHTSFSPDCPLMVMETEAIKQVFLNLVQNAIQAMPTGGKLQIFTEYNPAANTNIVKIIDSGKGIPQHMLSQLGQPFFTTRKSGTGLGLMVSYRIVESHGGKIRVESIEDHGTTFTVELPVVNT